MTRKYRLRKRAEQQDETRQRIVDATIALHQSIGGLQTTISAIAERAGVERATVYRHFPDERALLQACTGHYIAQNPPPDPTAWTRIADPGERLCTALQEIYAYHRQTEGMSARAAIDIPQIPLLREVMAPFFAYWQNVQEILSAPWRVAGQDEAAVSATVSAAVGHAVAFTTWQSLVRGQGLDDATALRLMVCLVRCAAPTPR